MQPVHPFSAQRMFAASQHPDADEEMWAFCDLIPGGAHAMSAKGDALL